MTEPVLITVYGAEQLCASCVNLPSSKDTFEWLQAAIGRKFGPEGISYAYIDIFAPPEENKHQEMSQRVLNDEYFYPLIMVNDEVVGEGTVKLKTIYRLLEESGFQALT